jgi:hypothetical protein
MDLLRSCYETDVQFDVDGEIVRRVRWYFCAPGAPVFPGPSVFRSNNYGDVAGGQLGPGEVWSANRPWSNGALPGQPGTPCGDREWFVDGCPSDAPPLTFNGPLPACCSPNTAGHIGIQVGFQGKAPCQQGLDWTGAVFRMFDGVTGDVMTAPIPADASFPTGAVWNLPAPHPFFQWTVQGANQGAGGMCPVLFNSRPVVNGTYTIALSQVGSYAGYPGSLAFKGDDQNFWVHPFYQVITFGPQHVAGTIGIAVGMVGTNELGVEAGIESNVRAVARAELGSQVGVESALLVRMPAAIGVETGLEGTARSRRGGQLGNLLGVFSSLRVKRTGALGIKVATHGSYPGLVGLKAGIASKVRARLAGSLGVKPGLVSTLTAGILTGCCPGRVIPNVLTAVTGGGNQPATWSAVSGGWNFSDPSVGLSWILTCVNLGGGTFQWRTLGNVLPHCTPAYSVTSLTCAPFSVSTRVGISGGACPTVGVYTYVVHA